MAHYIGNNPVNYIDPTGHCRQPGEQVVWWKISTWAECGGKVSNAAGAWAEFWTDLFDVSDQIEMFGGMQNVSKVYKIKQDGLRFDDKQWGEKAGKHAKDWGLRPEKAEDRQKMKDIVMDIFKDADEVREGTWRGINNLPGSERGPARFFRKGNDVIVTTMDGEFWTVLKDGINNGSYNLATPIN